MNKDKEIHYCQGKGCMNEIPEPRMCCSGYDCGCMGMPIDPPYCSNECYDSRFDKGEDEDEEVSFPHI